MESHPIPQQISSYQFRLVGDMTLKQFFQIAGGAVISLIIYSLPIMGIIKWPFVILFALLGIALAFLPIEDRPLERWLAAFFRDIYSPTIFTFEKTAQPRIFFQEEAAIPQEKIIYPGGETKLQAYLKTTPTDNLHGKLEKLEDSFLTGLASILNPISVAKPAAPLPAEPPLTIPTQAPIAIPVIPKTAPKLVLEETRGQETKPAAVVTPVSMGTPAPGMIAEKQAQFSVEAAPPNPPTIPNTLTGQVMDNERKIVEGAILEVRDSLGQPVRALKSNKLGHFMVVTPLLGGRYEIITEKEGFEFEPVSFEAQGEIIPPIAVSGRKVVNQNES